MVEDQNELIGRIVDIVKRYVPDSGLVHEASKNTTRKSRADNDSFSAELSVNGDIGVFRHIIQRALVSVRGEKLSYDTGPVWYVRINLDYTHPGGGSNGYEIGTLVLSEDAETVGEWRPTNRNFFD